MERELLQRGARQQPPMRGPILGQFQVGLNEINLAIRLFTLLISSIDISGYSGAMFSIVQSDLGIACPL